MRLMFNGKNKNAFTLVEIVISVFIIIILTSVAFFNYSGYSSKAKDTVKIKDITNISEVIDFDLLNGGELSKPDSIVSENATIKDISGYDFGDTVWYEGKFGKENISKFPSLSFGSLKDEYKYYLSKNLDYYVIEAELANGEKVIKTNYTIKNTLANNTTNPTTPETGNQGGGTPETGNQGGGTPETGNQGEGTPGTGNQGGGTPETGNQGGGTPETGNQGGGTPETGNQGGGTPETGNQGGGTPETGNQGGGTPGTGNQGGGTPETGNQGGGTPETGDQGGGTPENPTPTNNLPEYKGHSGDTTLYNDVKIFLSFQIEDKDGDTVTMSSPNLPEGLSISGFNIEGNIDNPGNYNFDLVFSDGKGTSTLNINPLLINELPRGTVCYNSIRMGNSHSPSNIWLLFNSSTGNPDLNGDLAFFVKDYKQYRITEIYDLINQRLNNGMYIPSSFNDGTKSSSCYFNNSDFW